MQFFLPLHNPLGFGAIDFVELYVAIVLALLMAAWRPIISPLAQRLSKKTVLCMLLLAAAPVALRLALLPHHPIPVPDIYDEFGHLFVADTLRHFRLSNPAHPMHRFFETFFTLQQPTYSSIYPIGQGLMLAIGRALFGVPWAGVIVSTAAFCALCYWMLQAWVSPAWALAGGLLAIIEFGPLCQWMNDYWGGSFGAAAGCLVFGSLPRLAATERPRIRDAVALGLGLALHVLIRPYESIFLFFCVALFFVRGKLTKPLLFRAAPIVATAVGVACIITLVQNKSVTGNWTTLPYQVSQYQYGVPAALTFETNPTPHADLTPQQELGYKSQLAFRASGPETLGAYLDRLRYRVRYYRFFFLPPLYLALVAFLPALRQWRFAWIGITCALFALGTNFFPAFQLHYVAALTGVFILMSVVGLNTIYRWRPEAALVLLFLCTAHFAFWYATHIADDADISLAARPYETWDALNHRNPERRIEVAGQLAKTPGQLLVFVRYWPQHIFQDEWVYNEADIDRAHIVWARDLGDAENQKLRQYYPQRSVWLLEPDARPPKLQPYPEPKPEPAAPPTPPTPAPKPVNKGSQPNLMFENVPRD